MQPEAQLGQKMRAALEARGAFVFKVHGSALMMAGLPDLICCYRGYFVGIEVKMPGNKASKIQEHVHTMIYDAGGVVGVAYNVGQALAYLDVVDIKCGNVVHTTTEGTASGKV